MKNSTSKQPKASLPTGKTGTWGDRHRETLTTKKATKKK